MAIITCFGASDCSEESVEYKDSALFGKLCAESGLDLATGGYEGVMKAVFDGAKHSNIKRIAITSKVFPDRTVNQFANQVIECDEYIERLEKLIDIADAYVVFPGGPGTLTELAAVWTLQERIESNKPIITIGEQWHEILQLMNFYSEKSLESSKLITQCNTYLQAFDYLQKFLGKL